MTTPTPDEPPPMVAIQQLAHTADAAGLVLAALDTLAGAAAGLVLVAAAFIAIATTTDCHPRERWSRWWP